MSVNEISVQETFELITQGKATGVDVREEFEWQAGHWDGFALNPLSKFDPTHISMDKPIIFVCRSGNRSSQVCNAYTDSGLTVLNMSGGMKAWQAAGLPMSCTSGEPTVA
jgi:rhodanese-related sulfurtransferase